MSFSVAARIRGPAPPDAGATINPFSALNTMSEIQQRQQSMQLQQREMMGQQRFGMILNQAPDMQTGINAAMQDPLAAPYAADSIMRLQAALQDQRNITASVGKEANDGHEAILGAIASAPDPQTARQMAMQRFSILSPDAQKRELPAFSAALEGFTGGMEGMPPDQAAAQFDKNRAAIGVALKWDPATIRAATGMPAPFSQEVVGQGGVHYTVQVPTGLYPGQPVAPPMTYDPFTRTVHPVAPGATDATPLGSPTASPQSSTTTGVPQASPVAATGGTDTVEPPVISDAPPAGGAPGAPSQTGVTTSPLLPGEVPRGQGGLVTPPPASGMAPGFAPAGAIDPLTPQTLQQQKTVEAQVQRQVDAEKDTSLDISKDSAAIPALAGRMDAIQDQLKYVQAGGSAETRANAAKAVQSIGQIMGIPADQLQHWTDTIAGGSLPAEQTFVALIRSYAVQQLQQVAQGTGRVMLPEVQAFISAINATTDPQAIERLINTQGRHLLQVAYDRSVKWPQFRQAVQQGRMPGADISDFYGWYGQHMPVDDKLPTVTAGGVKIGPRPEWEAMGVPQPKPDQVYNPATGTFGPPPSAPIAR